MDDPSKIVAPSPDWLTAPGITNAGKLVLAGNPVKIACDTWPNFADTGDYVVSVGETELFRGRYAAPFSKDISEILECCATVIPEIPCNNTTPLVSLGDAFVPQVDVHLRSSRLSPLPDIVSNHIVIYPLAGGVSKQNLRACIEADKDIFDSRFLNRKLAFFLTVRSQSWLLSVRETELAPLYFIASEGDVLALKCAVSGESVSFTCETSGFAALDLKAVRRKFAVDCGVWPSVLDIFYNGSVGCRIVIEESVPARERYILRFRNSLGVFEKLEITGELSDEVMPSEDAEDTDTRTFRRFDTDVQDYVTFSQRRKLTHKYTVNKHVTEPRRMPLVADALASDECWLSGKYFTEMKVIPEVENFARTIAGNQICSLKWTFTPCEEDSHLMPEITTAAGMKRPRIFSRQFQSTFQ